ncbi:MAG: YopX family protein [Bacilli bacterium]|nr:YopX family protein [Bacilli bacterium]
MNRDFKFRLYDKISKHYCDNDSFMIGRCEILAAPKGDRPFDYEVISGLSSGRFSLEQFIEKYDKNGKEIYEKDVVHLTDNNGYNYYGVVTYYKKLSAYIIVNIESYFLNKMEDTFVYVAHGDYELFYLKDVVEVLGNYHDVENILRVVMHVE